MSKPTQFGCKTCGTKWDELNTTIQSEEIGCPKCGSDDIDEIVSCPFCGRPQYRDSIEMPVAYCHHDI